MVARKGAGLLWAPGSVRERVFGLLWAPGSVPGLLWSPGRVLDSYGHQEVCRALMGTRKGAWASVKFLFCGTYMLKLPPHLPLPSSLHSNVVEAQWSDAI